MVSKFSKSSELIASRLNVNQLYDGHNFFVKSCTFVSLLGVVDDPKVHAQLNCTAWMTVHTSDISFQLTGRQAYFEVRSEMVLDV